MLDNSKVYIELGVAKAKSAPEPLTLQTSPGDESATDLTDSTVTCNGPDPRPSTRSPRSDGEAFDLNRSSGITAERVTDSRKHSVGTISGTSTDVFSQSSDSRFLVTPLSDGKSSGDGPACFRAVRRAFLRCLEETPIMVSGLVLSILFCVTIIIIIPSTGRVRALSLTPSHLSGINHPPVVSNLCAFLEKDVLKSYEPTGLELPPLTEKCKQV